MTRQDKINFINSQISNNEKLLKLIKHVISISLENIEDSKLDELIMLLNEE